MVAECGPRVAREDVDALLPATVSVVRARRAEGGVDDHDEDDDYDDDYALPGPLAAAGASEVDMPVLLEDVLKGLPARSSPPQP